MNVFSAASSPELLAAPAAVRVRIVMPIKLYNHTGEEEGSVGSGSQDSRL